MSLPHQSVGRPQGQSRARSGTRSGTHRPADPRPAADPAPALRSDRSDAVRGPAVAPQRRCDGAQLRYAGWRSSRYTSRSDVSRLTLRQRAGRPDFEKAIVDEQADGLRLLIVVGAGGTLVA